MQLRSMVVQLKAKKIAAVIMIAHSRFCRTSNPFSIALWLHEPTWLSKALSSAYSGERATWMKMVKANMRSRTDRRVNACMVPLHAGRQLHVAHGTECKRRWRREQQQRLRKRRDASVELAAPWLLASRRFGGQGSGRQPERESSATQSSRKKMGDVWELMIRSRLQHKTRGVGT